MFAVNPYISPGDDDGDGCCCDHDGMNCVMFMPPSVFTTSVQHIVAIHPQHLENDTEPSDFSPPKDPKPPHKRRRVS